MSEKHNLLRSYEKAFEKNVCQGDCLCFSGRAGARGLYPGNRRAPAVPAEVSYRLKVIVIPIFPVLPCRLYAELSLV